LSLVPPPGPWSFSGEKLFQTLSRTMEHRQPPVTLARRKTIIPISGPLPHIGRSSKCLPRCRHQLGRNHSTSICWRFFPFQSARYFPMSKLTAIRRGQAFRRAPGPCTTDPSLVHFLLYFYLCACSLSRQPAPYTARTARGISVPTALNCGPAAKTMEFAQLTCPESLKVP